MGYHLDAGQLDRAFARFKDLADKKKVVTERDIEALVSDEVYQPQEHYRLEQLQVSCGDHRHRHRHGAVCGHPMAAWSPMPAHWHRPGGRRPTRPSTDWWGVPNELIEFAVNAVTEGIDAVGEVTIRIQAGGNGDGALPVNPQTGGRTYVFSGHGRQHRYHRGQWPCLHERPEQTAFCGVASNRPRTTEAGARSSGPAA